MLKNSIGDKSTIRRRGSLSSAIQSGIDGAFIIALVYFSVVYREGVFPVQYLVFMMLLLGAMGVVYDRFGIYSRQYGVTQEGASLGKAWTIVFLILALIGFLSKTSDLFSRQILTFVFVVGFLGQLGSHILAYWLQGKRREKLVHQKSLIIGTGQLAEFLYSKINENPLVK